jgi:predicted small integral membrane protein
VLAGRVAKFVMVLSVALFALLVAFDNIYDYGANFAFVRHVLSMDTTFHDPTLMGRAITGPMLWHLSYAAIILGEGLTGLAFAVAAVELARNLRGDAAQFRRSFGVPWTPKARSWMCSSSPSGTRRLLANSCASC